ncbi:sodium channel, voltage-gated, type IV, beta a [Lepisosteus oculatus]|uniref:Sodium channel, voltage-gated, type IV, beta a n=1 Tax=Lepisosteus oculatus TaxID=7918 RepID=W5MIH0_LEPOC|nr:PREDICTED: sodium channel subunit beta-4 [Lepisosteus oculatus]
MGRDRTGTPSPWQRCLRAGKRCPLGFVLALLIGLWYVEALEVSVGKVPSVQALNGSTVLLPCTYSTCIGIENLYFNWHFMDNGTERKMCEAVIKATGFEPSVTYYHDRVRFVGTSRTNNISVVLENVTFEDEGIYVCFARNPKEKNHNHSAKYTVTVVSELLEVDNTLTVMIASAVGGVIGLIIVIMVLKALILFIISKTREKNKECLVSSSGIDNTENGLSGSKADTKGQAKA